MNGINLERIGDTLDVGLENELVESRELVLVDNVVGVKILQILGGGLVVEALAGLKVVGRQTHVGILFAAIRVHFLLDNVQRVGDHGPEFGPLLAIAHVVELFVRPYRIEYAVQGSD